MQHRKPKGGPPGWFPRACVCADTVTDTAHVSIADGSRFLCNGIIRPNKVFGPTGFQDDDNSLSTSTCSYYLSGSSAKNVIRQVRFKYLDFPNEMSCADLSFTIHESLSSRSRAVRTICGEQLLCDEFVVGPLTRRSSLARLTISDKVAGSFRGFMAVFEEIRQ